MISANWSESNPSLADLLLAKDEFNPNSPAIQILMEMLTTTNVWLIDQSYKTTQPFKISLYLKPPIYDQDHLDIANITFTNAMSEIDRIIQSTHFGFSANYHIPSGWKMINLPRGFGSAQVKSVSTQLSTIGKPPISTTPEPLSFAASQQFSIEYYNIGSVAMSEFLRHVIDDAAPQLGGNLDLNGKGIIFPSKTIVDVLDEDAMTSNSDVKSATQQSIKAYVDSILVLAKAYADAGFEISPLPTTLHKLSGVKVGDVEYHNTSTKSIFVAVIANSDEAGDIPVLAIKSTPGTVIADTAVGTYAALALQPVELAFIVPPGYYYRVSTTLHFNAGHSNAPNWYETELG